MGTGPVSMVLIPGNNADWTVFRSFMERNAQRYTMYAVTLPGFGGTTPPPDPQLPAYALGEWVQNAEDAVATMIVERKLERPIVVGHGLGGHLALRLAMHRPGLVSKVVTLEGPPAFPMTETEISEEERARRIDDEFAPRLAQMTPEVYEFAQRNGAQSMVRSASRATELGNMFITTKPDVWRRYLMEVLAVDLREEMKDLSCPALVIGAIPDAERQSMPPSRLREFWRDAVSRTDKASLVFFEGRRHYLMDDAPVELDKTIAAFVAGEAVKSIGEPIPDPVQQNPFMAPPSPPPSPEGQAPAPKPDAAPGAGDAPKPPAGAGR
jgi:pimeloyl-ACP methyl ester carboxylesterase